MKTQTIPTADFYDLLQEVYNIFNTELFNKELPNCLITVQRKNKVMGYFSSNRWIDEAGQKIHELALNPTYFTTCNFIEVFQTMVHEMCHLWQFEKGKPSRRSYHNKEWARKMESIGLIPSSTGKFGGKRTGQSMNDYPDKGGLFEKVCIQLYKKGLFIKWFDRFPAVSHVDNVDISSSFGKDEDLHNFIEEDEIILQSLYTNVSEVITGTVSIKEMEMAVKQKQKTKYSCSGCESSLWGKPNLDIRCNACQINFREVFY